MNIAIIPARGGSKRIPRKNIRDFHGKPIIAKKYGAEIPFMRPKSISDDYATTLDVILHSINELELSSTDLICCIYATAPFLKYTDLEYAVQTVSEPDVTYCYAVAEYSYPIQRALDINPDGYCSMIDPINLLVRSQDLEKRYHDAGQFYCASVNTFLSDDSILGSKGAKPIILDSSRVQDIDTEQDWIKASLMFELFE